VGNADQQRPAAVGVGTDADTVRRTRTAGPGPRLCQLRSSRPSSSRLRRSGDQASNRSPPESNPSPIMRALLAQFSGGRAGARPPARGIARGDVRSSREECGPGGVCVWFSFSAPLRYIAGPGRPRDHRERDRVTGCAGPSRSRARDSPARMERSGGGMGRTSRRGRFRRSDRTGLRTTRTTCGRRIPTPTSR
jgi:hypothetical protein